jgi:prepilin-type N-terminal cleavage/methylation domain-containing protein
VVHINQLISIMNTKSLLNRGFTLIELLVVIAIIGILAAVVIGSLNDARSGGQNASIQQSIANIRSQAELVYNSNGYSYDGVCGDLRVTNLISAGLDVVNGAAYSSSTAMSAASNGPVATDRIAACADEDTRYIVQAPLANPSAADVDFWCVDSTGASREVTTPIATGDWTCN